MAINQNIQTFYQQSFNKDFSRDFLFRVILMTGVGLPTLGEADLVYAKTAKLPGRTIENMKAPYMGLQFNVPGGVTYDGSDAYDIEFYLDDASKSASGDIRKKFEIASREIFNDGISTGEYQIPDYNNQIVLAQVSKKLEPVGDYYNLIGAQLRKIDAIEYKMAEGKGDVMSVKTTMSYHYYTVGSQALAVQNNLGTN
jgi:hypothetical protein